MGKGRNYIDYKRKTADDVDAILKLNLSSKEYRKLITLVRSTGAWSMEGIKQMESVIHFAKHNRPVFNQAKEIVALYRLADINMKDSDWNTHWEVMRHD